MPLNTGEMPFKNDKAWQDRLAAMPEWLQEFLAEDETILWDGFDKAIIGTATRCGMHIVLVYDYEKMTNILVERDGMTPEDAMEYLDFNLVGAYVGEDTPITFFPQVT